jgi:hypothetical protein
MAGLLLAKLRYPGKAPVKLQAQECDSSLWNHVDRNKGLHIIEACTAVEGRVMSLHREGDGDLHIALDPEQRSVLNLFNVVHGHGTLVVEIICEHAPLDEEDKAACGDLHRQITIPSIGDRVRITGAYVTDPDYSWNEIHPVTRIDILP